MSRVTSAPGYHSAERRHRSCDRQKQSPAVLDELGAFHVEALRRVVDQHRRDADALRRGCDAVQRVREQVGAQLFARIAAADRESPDYRGPAACATGLNTEIGDHPVAFADDIGAREEAFVLQGPLL